jgi:hypothetical protein
MAKTNCPGFYAANSSNNGLLQIARVSANRLTIRQRMRWRIERGEEIRLITAAQDD